MIDASSPSTAPFSSFFGLLALLAETELNKEQRDFVSTARASCELLLEIIDSLLDVSALHSAQTRLALTEARTPL